MNILQMTQGIVKYTQIAGAAVAQVEKEVGAANGDKAVSASKLQLAVAYVLAACHVGECVPVPVVQEIATVVEMQVGIAQALGLFGKLKPTTTGVQVPPNPLVATASSTLVVNPIQASTFK